MPPAQCPECGRFLSQTFVQGLAVESAPCPKCESQLSAAQFTDELGAPAAVSGPAEEPAEAAELRDDEVVEPLRDWDRPTAGDDERFRQQPPPDGAIVAGAAGMGALLGALLSRRRVRGAIVGAGMGAIAAGVARRVWTLET